MKSKLPTVSPRHLALLVGKRARVLGVVSLTILGASEVASAQIAGTTQRPLPNVLLLVDSSGSMERMTDNSLPSANAASTCSKGVASTPNRWGMLLQALTGNLQPYFSCDEVSRAGSSFKNEFRIGGTGPLNQPYDADYFLPYHRPLSGDVPADACAFAPFTLPGAAPGTGLGPSGLGINTGQYTDSSSFPPEAFQPFKEQYLRTQYGTGANGAPLTVSAANTCTFEQANDGQLDATRDYIRFGLMMFDNDPKAGIGVTTTPLPNGGPVLSANPFDGQWSYIKSPTNPDPLGLGRPVGCATTSAFEVGARHWAAPPWEGRMVRFPEPDANLYDIARTNEEIQKVLLGTRPYGATPIDGMMEDARDYFWWNDYGPLGTKPGYADAYVKGANSCRDQFIVLLTDGAPNLDLRPACEGLLPLPAGVCPYPNKAAQVADLLSGPAARAAKKAVKTYVIGFSVNGAGSTTFVNDGFPIPYNNCKGFFNGVTTNGTNLAAMHTLCSTVATAPPKGSTADACCSLSEIAYYGSGDSNPALDHKTPPFFAETQADLVLSFGRVLGGISKAATTRTLPSYAPSVRIVGASSPNDLSADYIASFIPNAQKVWSGEIDRTRTSCLGPVPTQQPQTVAAGDSYAANTAAQAVAGQRLFVSVKATLSGTTVDSARTIRPWATAPTDGIVLANSGGAQVVGKDLSLTATANWSDALDIDANTCKRSRDIFGTTIPKLSASDCTKVIWGFATATATAQNFGGYPKFNVRCGGTASATSGFCSASVPSVGCTLNGPACPLPGEVCVPECSALGAVYRSTPVLNGPPTDLLRDDSYRSFSAQRQFRRPAMFVATTDGVLHAFKALSTTAGVPVYDSVAAEHELWAFVPPAVLPKLASNYPTGQQILLDGTVAVKEVVWDRVLRTEAPLFHTTLVSGMGAGGGGYYGLSVTDADCQGAASLGAVVSAPNGCLPAGSVTAPGTLATLATATTKGPQFLWQLTDVESIGAGDALKKVRRSKDNKDFVQLFGKESGSPAIATLLVNPDGLGPRQVGVAILPGGIDGPPVKGGSCPRAINGGAQIAFLPANFDASDNITPLAPRASVRQWASGTADPCRLAPVPGRQVTIVRADTGEIIRVFGRPNQDIPQRLNGVLTNAPFDSPIIGTPTIFPNTLGVTTQKIFVGDADGTLWRIDVSDPLPSNWSVTLFQDLVSANLAGAPGFAESQPVQIPPVLTQDPFGGLMITAATGDQENIVASTDRNYVMSIQEQRSLSPVIPGRSLVKWYQTLTNGTRVTGPMTVLDRTLYFASYRPTVPTTASACTDAGSSLLWGMDYFNAFAGPAGSGGAPRWCAINDVDAITGACLTNPLTLQNENPVGAYPSLAGAIIPGVTIRASLSCTDASGPAGAISGMSATTFSLFFGATAKGTGGAGTGTPQALRTSITRPVPRTAANIDSWALVVD